VVSVHFQEDIFSIRNKTAISHTTIAWIWDTLWHVLNLPPNTIMEYKTHLNSIKRPGRLGPQRLLFQNIWDTMVESAMTAHSLHGTTVEACVIRASCSVGMPRRRPFSPGQEEMKSSWDHK
jgi:hypothetical protein